MELIELLKTGKVNQEAKELIEKLIKDSIENTEYEIIETNNGYIYYKDEEIEVEEYVITWSGFASFLFIEAGIDENPNYSHYLYKYIIDIVIIHDCNEDKDIYINENFKK
jgi:hypothetical protein